MISTRIWKKWLIHDPVVSVGWLVFPNEKGPHDSLKRPIEQRLLLRFTDHGARAIPHGSALT
jgi:hypothetical protein